MKRMFSCVVLLMVMSSFALISNAQSGQKVPFIKPLLETKQYVRKIDPKLLEFLRKSACTSAPSCSAPDYILSDKGCEGFHPGEGCYICSVSETLKEKISCPEGWNNKEKWIWESHQVLSEDGVSWYGGGFRCETKCFINCQNEQQACFAKNGGAASSPPSCWEEETSCRNKCPSYKIISNPCPDGFVFKEAYPNAAYNCEYDRICTQCNAVAIGGVEDKAFCSQWN